jgi:hypothetical protein
MTDSPDPATLTDDELVDAYERTDGEGAVAEAILAEIQKRGLDV